nr:acetoin utilization protein AcuC [Nesterenkonia alba]
MTQLTRTPPPTSVVWDSALLNYRFNATHPMDPVRLELTERLCRELGVFDAEHVSLTVPGIADDDALATVHSREYIAAVHRASEAGKASTDHGLGTEDTPVFEGIHRGAARIAAGTLGLAEALASGAAVRGVNFAGGMHHASRAKAGGFCVYNDAALAIQHLRHRCGVHAVYIDLDAHHGDGTQQIFYDDADVLTISMHQSGVSLFPGTGFPNETGGPGAEGSAVNIAVPEGTGDAGFLRAFEAVIPAVLRAFEPDVIVSQHGCDSHTLDPMSDLHLSIDAHRLLALRVGELADELCDGRWIATGGGGYAIHTVVPRSWTQLTAAASGAALPKGLAVPGAWRDYVRSTYGVDTPETMDDGADLRFRSWEAGYDPEDDLDRAVIQTRREIFPLWGMDPWFD